MHPLVSLQCHAWVTSIYPEFSKSIYPWIHNYMALSAWGRKYIYWLIPNEGITTQNLSQKWSDEQGALPWRSRENIYAMWYELQSVPCLQSTGFPLYAIIKQIYYTVDNALSHLICALLIFRLRKLGKLALNCSMQSSSAFHSHG